MAYQLAARHQLRAPPLLMTEVGSAIWKKVRRGQFAEAPDALARYADLGRVVDIVENRTSELAVRALEIALLVDHAIYDCVYLALAEADDDVLITADAKFCAKMQATSFARHVEPLA